MDILEIIRNDDDLKNKVRLFCDLELYDKYTTPEDLNGEMRFSISGKAFGFSGDGSEFVLLDDGTIGLNGSEGDVGRIAENMYDLFSLLLNCPCFYDFMLEDLYFEKNKELFRKFCKGMEKSYKEDFNNSEYINFDYDTVKSEISEKLNIPLDDDISKNTMMKFYHIVTREPKYGYTYEGEFISDFFFGIEDSNFTFKEWIDRMMKGYTI